MTQLAVAILTLVVATPAAATPMTAVTATPFPDLAQGLDVVPKDLKLFDESGGK